MCSGRHRPWAMSAPLASISPVEKSSASLITNERAVRTTVTAISSAIAVKRILQQLDPDGIATCSAHPVGPRPCSSRIDVDADVVGLVDERLAARRHDHGGVVLLDDDGACHAAFRRGPCVRPRVSRATHGAHRSTRAGSPRRRLGAGRRLPAMRERRGGECLPRRAPVPAKRTFTSSTLSPFFRSMPVRVLVLGVKRLGEPVRASHPESGLSGTSIVISDVWPGYRRSTKR